MKTCLTRIASALAAFALLAAAGAAGAADLKVFSTTALTEIWHELKPKFEERGHKLELVLQPSGALGS
jgi:ABC-type molybdate transport system substrate-binding protein